VRGRDAGECASRVRRCELRLGLLLLRKCETAERLRERSWMGRENARGTERNSDGTATATARNRAETERNALRYASTEQWG